MVNEDFIITEYPLHWFVWNNNYEQLEETLKKGDHDKDKIDNRGRTPLMLAVTLGHLESARILLNYQSNVNYENKDGWTVVQEAVATGDPKLLQMVVERRDLQRYKNRMGGIPELLQKLKEAPDFYVEMKWDFTSWVPLVSRRCPSDTYKVYKQGSNVRVDTTLMGFENANWKRGNRSYVFLGKTDGATMMEIDHDLQQVYCEELKTTEEFFENVLPNEEIISQRLTNPIITAYIDTDKISFERNKSGIWGWRSDKNEEINNYECKVFSATNVELITKTRSEHLTENDKIRSRNLRTPLQNFFNIPEIGTSENNVEYSNNTNPCNIKPEEYFDSALDLGDRDIGRPKEVNVKVQKFRANLWLCEDYPLSLPEQILPIVDLMAISSSHFAKLKDFIQMQLPSGFPVKIEIPIIQVLNARITFGNIFALDRAEPKVSILQEDDRPTCILDESLFQPPKGYMEIGNVGSDGRRQFSNEEEDDLLQFAIQQSLNESGIENDEEKVDIYEALCLEKSPTVKNSETTELQRAIQASLVEMYQEPATTPFDADPSATSIHNSYTDLDYDLTLALTVSKRESEQEELDRRKEEELLQLALNLSLKEK